MKRGTLTLAIAGIVLALTLPAGHAGTTGAALQLAQAQGDGQHEPGETMKPPADRGDRQQMHAQRMKEMCDGADGRHMAAIATSEAKLKLTEAQKPAWSKFVEASTAAHQSMTKLMCANIGVKQPRLPLPERLARAEEMAKARLAHIQTLRPAVEELYKVLTPEQQKIADGLPLASAGQGRGHGGHHMQRTPPGN